MSALVRCVPRSRRAAAVAALAAVLTASTTGLLGGAAGGLPAAAADAPLQDAVVSLAPGAALPGVEVLRELPALGAAVVRGPAEALARLAGAPGVRGVAEDVALTVTGGTSAAPAVLAADGLAAPAGQPGAGRGVRVAVVDTGVADTEALSRASGRLVDGVDASDPARVRTSGAFTDGHGHGTHMASVVAGGPLAALGGRALGVAPGATVVVVKVADASGATSLSRVLAGLEWVVKNKKDVDVVNLALAAERPGEEYGRDPLVDAVAKVRASGITAVVATGNTADRVADPGFDPRGLSVGAADLTAPAAVVAPFSGSDVVAGLRRPDVVASGVGVLGAVPPGSVIDAATPDRPDGLVRGSGTSQATAVVAGAAALLLADHPDASPDQVRASLRGLAVDLPGERDGAGLLRVPSAPAEGEPARPTQGKGKGKSQGKGAAAPAPAASSWGASSWGASSWGASSWGASSWGASSWGASSWGASSWGASSWGASSWGASSWGASSWGASSWGAARWGEG